jgi:hypothetical protein
MIDADLVSLYCLVTMNKKCLEAFGLLNKIRERRGISQRAWAAHCPAGSGMNQARIYELLKILKAFNQGEEIDIGRRCTMEKVQALAVSLKYIMGMSGLSQELFEENKRGKILNKQVVVALILDLDESDEMFGKIVKALIEKAKKNDKKEK